MRVASKVGNLPSKFGHRPLGSRIIRYVRDGQTDGRTKATLIAPFPTCGGITITVSARRIESRLKQYKDKLVKMRYVYGN